jgi:hypothetical protein
MKAKRGDGERKNAARGSGAPRAVRFIRRHKAGAARVLALLTMITVTAIMFLTLRENGGERADRLYFDGLSALDSESGFVKFESRLLLLVKEGDAQSSFRIRSSAEREGAGESRRWSARLRADRNAENYSCRLYYGDGLLYQAYGERKTALPLEQTLVPDRLGVPELSFSSGDVKLSETEKNPEGILTISMTLDGGALSERLTRLIALLGYEDESGTAGQVFHDVYLTAEFARDGALSGRKLSFMASSGAGSGRQLICDFEIKAARDSAGVIMAPDDLDAYEVG